MSPLPATTLSSPTAGVDCLVVVVLDPIGREVLIAFQFAPEREAEAIRAVAKRSESDPQTPAWRLSRPGI